MARNFLTLLLSFLLTAASLGTSWAVQAPDRSDQRVSKALQSLKAGDPRVRLEALRRLERLGPRAAPAVPALIAGLADPDPRIRGKTAEVLRAIGPLANPAVPTLLNALSDPVREVRSAAGWALMKTKPDPKMAIPKLLASIHSGPGRRCLIAVYVLGTLGEPAVPVLIDLVKEDDPPLRRMAASSLGQMGPAAKSAVPALIEALRVPDREARESLAGALAGVGTDAVEPLIRALRDPDSRVRGGASLALEGLGERAAPAVPALIAALSNPVPPDDPKPPRGPSFDDFIREGEPRPSGYVAALHAIGSSAAPALLKQLDLPDLPKQRVALRALGFLGDEGKAAVPRLIQLLNDPAVRDDAASALGGIGSAARPAIPALVGALKEGDNDFRARAAETLGRVGWSRQAAQYSTRTEARGAIAPLAGALKDPEPRVRAAAARALGDIGGESSVVISELVAALNDPVADVRVAVLKAFGRIGAVPPGSRDVLLSRFTDSDARVRAAAAKAIDEEALKAGSVVRALLAALKDPNADVRAAAARTLEQTHVEWFSSDGGEFHDSPGLLANPAAPTLLRETLGDSDPRVRAAVAWLLPVFKDQAAASVPLLTARLKDSDPVVRRAAGEALSRFGPAAKEATAALLEALDDRDVNYANDNNVCAKAAKALEAIGPAAKAAMLSRLTARLGDPEESVRRRVAWALQMLGDKVSSPLFRTLADPQTARLVKVEIVGLLVQVHGPGAIAGAGRPGAEASEAIPALRELTRDDDDTVRVNARKLLGVVEPREEAARTLLEAVREESPDALSFDFDEAVKTLGTESIGAMVEGLNDPDDEVRTAAAHALAQLAEDLPRVGDEKEGEKPDPAAREARVRGLRLRAQVADALVAALNDPDTQVRWAAAWGLYALGTGDNAIPALIEMARDRTTRVRPGAHTRIATALGGGNGNRCEPSEGGALLRVGAIQALGGFGESAAPAVPVLIDAIRSNDGLTRWFAASVLAEIGPKAKAAVPDLIVLVRSKDEVSTIQAWEPRPDRLAIVGAKALGKIGPDARAAVPALIEALTDRDESLRREAAEALGGIGAPAAAAIPALTRALKDPGWSVGENAAEALGRMGAAVPALTEALRGRNAEVRRRAMSSLGSIGPKAAQARPELIRALADPDEETRAAATEALGHIGKGPEGAAAIPGLVAALKDSDRLVRASAAAALGQVGPRDQTVIPALIAALREKDRDVRFAAKEALWTIGMPAFPALRDLLRDDDADLRDDAALALAEMASVASSRREEETEEQARTRIKAPRDALFTALKDENERVRAGASRALAYIGKEAVPDLIVALGNRSALVQVQAARALGLMGNEAVEALPPLRERRGDSDPEVRRAAEAAIKAILKADP